MVSSAISYRWYSWGHQGRCSGIRDCRYPVFSRDYAAATPLLSLRHLAACANVSYGFLRRIVTRQLVSAYSQFVIVGRSGKRRHISTPTRDLLTAQRWIVQNVLAHLQVGPNSFAYAKGSSIVQCAKIHCASRWLLKYDVRDFFSSIDERRVYGLFIAVGYRPLVAFELARICTWPIAIHDWGSGASQRRRERGANYAHAALGSLPIGAPTSPMLSNCYMAPFDSAMSRYCAARGLVYSRYADDFFVSSQDHGFRRSCAADLSRFVGDQLSVLFLSENGAKRKIVPPGARKIVLGLLVDGPEPRLAPEFKKRLRMHYHFLERFGPARHKAARSFPSVPMLERHLRGLVAFATQVEPVYGEGMHELHARVPWAFVAQPRV